ncbi:MAG: aminotransferase class I/II-fold pyridoxal phosphate-dependent enzyme, partial [Myxococcota bacterium]|nr:aminotransferase class I/II-fold pyridoxal phosphate-dependent enzyme [Myxococcota bacterium]
TVRWVPLDPDDLSLDLDALAAAMGPRTKLVVINTPMNPTGKVFDVGELAAIGELARRHDAFVVCDEVYEHLTYGGRVHTPAATLDGLFERTVTISSTAKTFSMTGWKVGYAVAPPALSRAIRMSHQFVTFCTPMPFQHAMAAAIDGSDDFYPELLAEYDERRRLFGAALEAAGFRIVPPQGTYYVMADITPLGVDDDVEFCRMLPERFGVAAIPVSAFYRERRMGRHLVRFAFCKRTEVLERAGERLQTLRRVLG